MTERYAVIGHPVSHSLSPRIHPLFAAQFGHELSYEAIEVSLDELAERLQRLHAEGFRGLNVTLPLKLRAAEACESRSERAALAGAANTLTRTDTGWRGDITDGAGLIRELKDNLKVAIAGKRVVVLGAGGAARSIVKPLLDEKPAELVLSHRNPWKPEEIAPQFKQYGPIRPCTHLALKGDRFDLVINATSAGHTGQMVKLPGPILADGGVCYDMSYGKAAEPFLNWARTQNARLIADGLGLLVEQAAVSYQLWHGVRPDTAPVLAALRGQV